jgi:hypothetical protein
VTSDHDLVAVNARQEAERGTSRVQQAGGDFNFGNAAEGEQELHDQVRDQGMEKAGKFLPSWSR